MSTRYRPVLLAIIVVLVAALGVIVGKSWGEHTAGTSTTTTTTNVAVPSSALWPFADTTTRFADPVSAATAFALNYLDFTTAAALFPGCILVTDLIIAVLVVSEVGPRLVAQRTARTAEVIA